MKVIQILHYRRLRVTKVAGKQPVLLEAASNLAYNSFSFKILLKILKWKLEVAWNHGSSISSCPRGHAEINQK